MVEKGNESKRAQYEATLTFTQEAQSGVGHLIDSLEQRIQEKQSKLELIDQQKKNFQLEISGLEIAHQGLKAKLKKQEVTKATVEAQAKATKDELRKVQKEITPELVKSLYQLLEKKSPAKIVEMIEAVIGMLRNTETVNSSDVEMYLKKQEGLIYKMQNIVCGHIRQESMKKHFDKLVTLKKFFFDSNEEEFKVCAPYAAFLVWGQQLKKYSDSAQLIQDLQKKIDSLQKELEEKNQKMESLKNIVDSYVKDGYVDLFLKEIQEDRDLIAKYQDLEVQLRDNAIKEQQTYLNFERQFFQELTDMVATNKRNEVGKYLQGKLIK